MSDPPPTLLVAKGARLAAETRVILDGLDLETRGSLLVLCGDAGPLVAALSGLPENAGEAADRARQGELVPLSEPPRVVGGALSVAGADVASGAHHALLGVSLFDPPYDHDRTVGDHLEAAIRVALARRGRVRASDITRETTDALGRAGIAGGPKRRLGTLAVRERRAGEVAAAAVCAPAVLLLDRPLHGLEGSAAAFVIAAIERAREGRGAIVRTSTLSPGTAEGDLARRASDCAVFTGAELVFFGTLAEHARGARVVQVTARANAAELARGLAAAGFSVSGGAHPLTIGLGEGRRPSEILKVAAAVRASVVEIIPLM